MSRARPESALCRARNRHPRKPARGKRNRAAPEGRGAKPPENRAPVQCTVKGHWRATPPSAGEGAAPLSCAVAVPAVPAFAEEEAPRSLSESESGTRWRTPALPSSSSTSAGSPPMPPPKTVVAGGEAAPWGWPSVTGTPATGRSQSSSVGPGVPASLEETPREAPRQIREG